MVVSLSVTTNTSVQCLAAPNRFPFLGYEQILCSRSCAMLTSFVYRSAPKWSRSLRTAESLRLSGPDFKMLPGRQQRPHQRARQSFVQLDSIVLTRIPYTVGMHVVLCFFGYVYLRMCPLSLVPLHTPFFVLFFCSFFPRHDARQSAAISAMLAGSSNTWNSTAAAGAVMRANAVANAVKRAAADAEAATTAAAAEAAAARIEFKELLPNRILFSALECNRVDLIPALLEGGADPKARHPSTRGFFFALFGRSDLCAIHHQHAHRRRLHSC